MMFRACLVLTVLIGVLAGCGGDDPDAEPDVGFDAEPELDLSDGDVFDTTSDVSADAGSDLGTDGDSDSVDTRVDADEAITLVADLTERRETVGATITVTFSVSASGEPRQGIEIELTAEGASLEESSLQSESDGSIEAQVTLDTSVGESTVSASVDGSEPVTTRIVRGAEVLWRAEMDGPSLSDWTTQTFGLTAVDRFDNPKPGTILDLSIAPGIVDGTLDSGETTGQYETDEEGHIEFSITTGGFLGERRSGDVVDYGSATEPASGRSVPLVATLEVSEPPALTIDLPPHYVVRPGEEVDVAVRAQSTSGEPFPDLSVELLASDDGWSTSAGITDEDGVAWVTLGAPATAGSEAQLSVRARGVGTPLGLVVAGGPTFVPDGEALMLSANSLQAYDVADERTAVVVVDSVTFSDGFDRGDTYVFEPATSSWTHLLDRRHTSALGSTAEFFGGRYVRVEASEPSPSGDPLDFAALVDLESGAEHVLVSDGARLASEHYEEETEGYFYAIGEGEPGDEEFRIFGVSLDDDDYTPEELAESDAEPVLGLGECDDALYWQDSSTREFVRTSGVRNDRFPGAGADVVQLYIVHARSGACSAFLHDFDGEDDALYQVVPRRSAYYLRRLMLGHDANLIIPSRDLSFIVVDSWTDSILRTIDLAEPLTTTELMASYDLIGFHRTELSPDESFLVIERHIVGGQEELFYVVADGSGPDPPLRISPDIPVAEGGWPLRDWVTSPEFDEVVILHPVAASERGRILGAFTVDLLDPVAGASPLDPTVGPDPFEEGEGLEQCGYDPSGRWLFLVGDPETAREQSFYLWDREGEFFRTVWAETADDLEVEFLGVGDWASTMSETGIHLVDLATAMTPD